MNSRIICLLFYPKNERFFLYRNDKKNVRESWPLHSFSHNSSFQRTNMYTTCEWNMMWNIENWRAALNSSRFGSVNRNHRVISTRLYNTKIANGTTPWSTLTLHGPRFSLIEQKLKKMKAEYAKEIWLRRSGSDQRMDSVRDQRQKVSKNDLYKSSCVCVHARVQMLNTIVFTYCTQPEKKCK